MKKLYTLILSSVILLSCDSEKKELMATFNDFTKKSDSIAEVHNKLKATHDDMKARYETLYTEFKNMESQDSTVLRGLREQGLMIERHDAITKSHAEIIEAHKNANPDFEDMNAITLNEKIREMEKWHDRMMMDHKILKEEHDKMQYEYAVLEQKITMTSEANDE